MEMLEGRTLEGQLAARTKLSIPNTVGIALQLCDALAAVHRAGVVHRDVKPSNILVLRGSDDREQIKLVDFGIAKMDEPGSEELTGIGAVIGTPAYMSPEQLLGLDDVDHTTDIYALGVTMFECLSGSLPYTGNYPQVLLQATADSAPPSVRSVAPEIPLPLALAVDRAIAKSRASRYATVQDLAAALEAAVPGAPRTTSLLGPPPLPRREPQAPYEGHRRRAQRAPYNTPVQIVSADGTVGGRTEDISEGGLLVLSRAACVPDQRVVVRFAMPMDGKIVSLEADVRWVRVASAVADAAPVRAIGIEFVDIPAATRAAIGHYVWLMSDKTKA
jgi:serine/threonine protein kinase